MNLIEKYSLKRAVDDRKGEIYRGFLIGDFKSIEDYYWKEYYDFNDGGHRRIFINLSEKSMFTYCEGDLTLEVYGNSLNFFSALKDAAEFYCQ